MARRAVLTKKKVREEPLPPRIRPVMTNEAARRFGIACAKLMKEDHCEDVVMLDLVGISPICDYFVIGTGTSDRQMRAVADHIEQMGRKMGERAYIVDGYQEGAWVIVDYVDTVIHLFDEERRLYYDLDSMWGERPRIDWTV
ncbi:MAG: ribosome silencing factor [Planctomycetota bacterium]